MGSARPIWCYDGAATLELVPHYIDAPSRYARLALERAKELMV